MLAGLTQKVTVGMKILGIGIEIEPFMSLPKLQLNATQLRTSEVGANCVKNGETVQQFKDSYKNLTHVGYDIGIGGGLGIDLGFFGNYRKTFAATKFPLATQCLVYKTDGPSLGLAYATSVLADHYGSPSYESRRGDIAYEGYISFNCFYAYDNLKKPFF
ncbi:hypothetical protein B0J11DRAFT_523459 [Dendryphion nanum]|uniref:Uncharacterized protein n=1 Tax=Dendryphion nanum TaxID=256645 RepID=A0A9P9E463_9PLEO|nr:hypothetical protein B0J11DRAFT_523459 [Dendryphion nanum]